MKNLICSCISVLLLISHLSAQNSDAEIFRDRARTPLTCVWSTTAVYDQPGKSSRYLGPLNFGEEVTRAGRKAYVGSEKRTYIEVFRPDGQKGWVYDYHFVNNGMAAVVQSKSRIFQSPRARSSRSSDYFSAGERVVMGNVSGDWLELYSQEKMKLGWIEGLDRVSTQEDDLLAAEETERAGVRTYSEGSNGARDYNSSQDKYRSRGPDYLFADPTSANGANPNRFRGEIVGNLRSLLGSPSGRSGSSNSRSANLPTTITQTNADGGQIMQETYVDKNTGKLRNRTTETGKLFLINFPDDRDNVFVGYHKTLPVGSRVAINFPDNQGFVEIEIIGALSSQHTEALGLYPDCVKIIFGKFAPENIKFTYSDKK